MRPVVERSSSRVRQPFLISWSWQVVILLMRLLIDLRFHQPRLYMLSHPAGISFWVLCCFRGAVRRLTGAGVDWKQRHYTSKSDIR